MLVSLVTASLVKSLVWVITVELKATFDVDVEFFKSKLLKIWPTKNWEVVDMFDFVAFDINGVIFCIVVTFDKIFEVNIEKFKLFKVVEYVVKFGVREVMLFWKEDEDIVADLGKSIVEARFELNEKLLDVVVNNNFVPNESVDGIVLIDVIGFVFVVDKVVVEGIGVVVIGEFKSTWQKKPSNPKLHKQTK